MLFNSIEFLCFLPIVFLLYWCVFRRLQLQNLFMVVVSYVFLWMVEQNIFAFNSIYYHM